MRTTACVLLLLATACPLPPPPWAKPDDPPPTENTTDTADAGMVLLRDSGVPDAASEEDAGSVEDAGTPDAAGPQDAGTPDTGPEETAVDAGTTVPNLGWIGGACTSASDCTYADSLCITSGEGFPGGTCSQGCTRTCPDLEGPNSVTFCVDPPVGVTAADGICVSRCDYGLYPGTGCRMGYGCQELPRYNEATTVRFACLPGEPAAQSTCLQELTMLGVPYEPTTHTPTSPAGQPNLTCTITDPVRITGPIHGVSFRSGSNPPSPILTSCALALALERMTVILEAEDVEFVEHYGTYNCRVISGTLTLSEHAFANGIDLAAFVFANGTRWTVNDDFEIGESPTTPAGIWQWDLVNQMHVERIFNIILTPNYNAAHRNHFHVDMTSGANYLGSPEQVGFRLTDEEDRGAPWLLAPNLHGD